MNRIGWIAMGVGAACVLAGAASVRAQQGGVGEGRGEAALVMDVRRLDFENNKKLGLMYMPVSAKLSEEKPAGIAKEPAYRGKAKYAVLTIGNTAKNRYVLAFDEPEGQDAKVFADRNGNGDLTDDGDGAWETKTEKEGAAPQYSGTIAFDVKWALSDGSQSSGPYAINFYRSPDRDTINYYRASARTGKIDLNGKSYEVMLYESDCDGMFNKLYDPSKPTPVEQLPKPVYLSLDGDRYDIRGTFGFGGYNYVARVSDDGSKLVMEPTIRQITLPRPAAADRAPMLAAGGPLPDFEAVWWSAASDSGESKPQAFKMSDFKGKKIVVLDLWATWCGPCMRGLPHISKIAEAVKGQDVEVIALNVWDEAKAYERWAKEKGPTFAFRIARDPAGREREASVASRIFRLSGIPATYVIDRDGKIAAAVSGYNEGDKQIEHALVRLGVKIEGIKPEDAAEPKKAVPMKGMVPATGMR